MNFGSIKLFSLIETKMSYLSESHDLLSQNVANADTPGYVPKRLKKMDFEKLAQVEAHRLKMRATSPLHQAGGSANATDFRVEDWRKTNEKTPVDNKIALEQQMAQLSANSQDYKMITSLYHKTTGMFKTAIGNRS